MPTAWYQHQTCDPASAWLKLKGLLSSGTRREFKFSCRGAAGTRNSRHNKDCMDRCHLIGGKPSLCSMAPRLQRGVVLLWINCQDSCFYAPEPTNPRQSKWTCLPSLFPACSKILAEASYRDQPSEGHRGAGQSARLDARCVHPDLGEMLVWKTTIQRMVHHCNEIHETGRSQRRCGKLHQGSNFSACWTAGGLNKSKDYV